MKMHAGYNSGGYRVRARWVSEREDWVFGWLGLFARFGIGMLLLGPVRIQFLWPVPEETPEETQARKHACNLATNFG